MRNNCDKCGISFLPDYEGGHFGCEIPYYNPTVRYVISGVLEGQDLLEFEKGEEFLLMACPMCGYKWTEPVVDK